MTLPLTSRITRGLLRDWTRYYRWSRNGFQHSRNDLISVEFAQENGTSSVPCRWLRIDCRAKNLSLGNSFGLRAKLGNQPPTNSHSCGWHRQPVTHRGFHTSSPRNAIPPPVILLFSRVAKMGAIFLGRSIRKWWNSLPLDQKAEYLDRARRYRKYLYGGMGALGFAFFVYWDSHIEETPFTKRKRFVVFNSQQFDLLAKREFAALIELYRSQIVPASLSDPSYYRISSVANRLLQANKDLPQIKGKEWSITVVKEDSMQNAMVLPCGNIFVFTGMLDICETNDELAAILGHEMAHAVLGHGAENASYLHFMDLLLVAPIALLWALLPSDWTAAFATFIGGSLQDILFTLPYSRAMEIEADEVGLILAAKACFDIRVVPVFWAKMAYVTERGGMPQIEFLSTHPSHEHRQHQVEEVLEKALVTYNQNQCPLLQPLDTKKMLENFKRRIDQHDLERVAIRLKI